MREPCHRIYYKGAKQETSRFHIPPCTTLFSAHDLALSVSRSMRRVRER